MRLIRFGFDTSNDVAEECRVRSGLNDTTATSERWGWPSLQRYSRQVQSDPCHGPRSWTSPGPKSAMAEQWAIGDSQVVEDFRNREWNIDSFSRNQKGAGFSHYLYLAFYCGLYWCRIKYKGQGDSYSTDQVACFLHDSNLLDRIGEANDHGQEPGLGGVRGVVEGQKQARKQRHANEV